jgi:hypothetical protein
MEDFLTSYIDYRKKTECPIIYHRWAALSLLGAFLGRRTWFPHGSMKLTGNQYLIFMGVSGTRKSTAILEAKDLLSQTGYDLYSADKTTKEQYLQDLNDCPKGIGGDKDLESILNSEYFTSDDSVESYIVADELNDLFGNTDVLGFVQCLGKLWDYKGTYKYRLRNGTNVSIPNPLISMLGGNTPSSFAKLFPPDILSQGFFSRILLIHGEPTGVKHFRKPVPDDKHTKQLLQVLEQIRITIEGECKVTDAAWDLLKQIYETPIDFYDVRFESYPTRRYTHLMKLCLLCAASRISNTVEAKDVVLANTMLTYIEYFMPKALGEFGKAKNSDVTDKVIRYIESSIEPPSIQDIWKQVSNDLERFSLLGDLLRNLAQADKILQVANNNKTVFLPKRRLIGVQNNNVLDFTLLTSEEREKLA